VAKREWNITVGGGTIWADGRTILGKTETRVETDIIPLNGYCLCQTVNLKKISELDVTSEEKIDREKAIVRYVGLPNKRYKVESYADHPDLRAGDLVLLDRYPLVFLERKKYFARFDGDNLYIVVPRKRISMVIKREEV
jgi:hypothetical protein